ITASTTAGAACPRISGPHEPTKSRYERPSTSVRRAPSPRAMNGGEPPTARNARTGLFTPPGMTRPAASSRRLDSLIVHLPAPEVDAVPWDRRHAVDPAGHDRGDDVDGRRVGGLAAHQRLTAVGLREVGAALAGSRGVDVRVVDHRHAEALALEI